MRRADLAALTAFVAVADNLSFRAAASHIGVTPAALSHTNRSAFSYAMADVAREPALAK